MYPLNLAELTAFSKDWGPRSVADNYYDRHVLHKSMESRRETYPGGLHIRLPLMVAGDPHDRTGKAIGYTEGWNYENLQLFDSVQFEPKMDVQVVCIWDYEVALNGTAETQYADLIMQRQAAYTKIMADRTSRYLYGRGQGTNRINGLEDIFDNTGTFGKIDRADSTYYNAYVQTLTGTDAARALTKWDASTMLTSVTDGPIRPDVILSTPGIWNSFESILTQEERRPNTLMAQAGFENITLRSVPITYDKNMPKMDTNGHNLFYLNFDFIKWYAHEQYNMRRYPWQRMPNNAGQFEVIINVGNVCSNNLRYLAALKNVAAQRAA